MHAYITPESIDVWTDRLADDALGYLGDLQRDGVRIPAAAAALHVRLVDIAHGVCLARRQIAHDAMLRGLIEQGLAP